MENIDRVKDCCLALLDAQRVKEMHNYQNQTTWEFLLNARSFIMSYDSSRRREQWRNDIHPSHQMTDWYTDIRSPVGTARFYSVRHCKNCEHEMSEHPAGQFKDRELEKECEEGK